MTKINRENIINVRAIYDDVIYTFNMRSSMIELDLISFVLIRTTIIIYRLDAH